MDKGNMPVRRNRKPLNLFRAKISEPIKTRDPRQKTYRKEELGWLKTIFKAFEKVWDWFGAYFGKPSSLLATRTRPENNYPHWFCRRIARNRRRRKLGNISRRINR